MSRLIVLAVLVACGHHDAKPVTPVERPSEPAVAPADPAPCEDVAVHAMKLSPTTEKNTWVPILTRHCKDDLWSLETRKCFLTSNTLDEGAACEKKMTDAQLKSLDADI